MKTDERFADTEFAGFHFDIEQNLLRILLVRDPADDATEILMHNVRDFSASGLGRQNTISHLEYGIVGDDDLSAFVKELQLEGVNLVATNKRDTAMGLFGVFVAANGGSIYFLCDMIEKTDGSGQQLYAIGDSVNSK